MWQNPIWWGEYGDTIPIMSINFIKKKQMEGDALMQVMGTYRHTLDAKSRLAVPARFRDVLGEQFFLLKAPDKCLFIYDEEEWHRVTEQLRRKSATREDRNEQRRKYADVYGVELDKQGRILIPPELVEYAGLKKDVVVFGCDNRIEVWDSEEWEKILSEPTEDEFDDIIW